MFLKCGSERHSLIPSKDRPIPRIKSVPRSHPESQVVFKFPLNRVNFDKGLKCDVQFEKNKAEHEIIYTGHKQEKADITPVTVFQQKL